MCSFPRIIKSSYGTRSSEDQRDFGLERTSNPGYGYLSVWVLKELIRLQERVVMGSKQPDRLVKKSSLLFTAEF